MYTYALFVSAPTVVRNAVYSQRSGTDNDDHILHGNTRTTKRWNWSIMRWSEQEEEGKREWRWWWKKSWMKPEWKDVNKIWGHGVSTSIPCILTSVRNTLTKILTFQLASFFLIFYCPEVSNINLVTKDYKIVSLTNLLRLMLAGRVMVGGRGSVLLGLYGCSSEKTYTKEKTQQ